MLRGELEAVMCPPESDGPPELDPVALASPKRSQVAAADTVLVRYFAVLRERRGCEEERVALLPGDTPARVFARLFPAAAEGGLRVMYAVDHAYSEPDQVLHAGAELAFIPPLGGG